MHPLLPAAPGSLPRWAARMRLLPVTLALVVNAAHAAPSAWPDWVLNPGADEGLVAAECVTSSGNLSLDRTQASALARATLAKQIDVKVQAMEETYSQKVAEGRELRAQTRFTTTAKLSVDQALAGSRVTRVEVVDNAQGSWLCAEVRLAEAGTRAFARGVVVASGATPGPATEELLLAAFRQRALPRDKP